jgi:hypothetical protein
MVKEKLYLICPDCHIEQTIRQKYGSDSYFLTALGTVFDISEFECAEEVHQFINSETISEIVIVNDVHCTFIHNTISKDENHETNAEKVLQKLLLNNSPSFNKTELYDQKRLLARLNIYRQAYALLDIAFIENKIAEGIIDLSGLIYNRENSEFEKLELEL